MRVLPEPLSAAEHAQLGVAESFGRRKTGLEPGVRILRLPAPLRKAGRGRFRP